MHFKPLNVHTCITFPFQVTWWCRAPSWPPLVCSWFLWQSCTWWQLYYTLRSLVWLCYITVKKKNVCCVHCMLYCINSLCNAVLCYFLLQGWLSTVWCISSASPVDTSCWPSTHWLTCTLCPGAQGKPTSKALIIIRGSSRSFGSKQTLQFPNLIIRWSKDNLSLNKAGLWIQEFWADFPPTSVNWRRNLVWELHRPRLSRNVRGFWDPVINLLNCSQTS